MNSKKVNNISRRVLSLLCTLAMVIGVCGADTPVYALEDSGAHTEKNAVVTEGLRLIPGGVPFGVKLYSEGVSIIEVTQVMYKGKAASPAKSAGICAGDIITAINGQTVSDAARVAEIIASSGGKTITVTLKRAGEIISVELTPAIADDGKYKAGIIIKDSTAGIGTVTYINPEDYSFAGLGHGICEGESGKLAPLTRGAVVNVAISGITKGQCGAPGELKGYFCSGKIGTLFNNTECGVYGIFAEYPRGIGTEAVEVGCSEELLEGDAEIWCTTDNSGPQKYTVKISEIEHSGKNTKNFVVTITDPRLIERTGGIVQGMSGSPILQNGKLVGAVTHVLINDPTKGYGIFIENMLAQAQKTE